MERKKIKCEWCGSIYDSFQNDKCPFCGGSNEKEEVENNPVYKKELKSYQTTDGSVNNGQKNGIKTFVIVCGGFILLSGVLSLFSKSNTETYSVTERESVSNYDQYNDVTVNEKEDSSSDSNQDGSSYESTESVLHTFYTSESIQMGKSIVEIPCISFEDSWSYKNDRVYATFYINIKNEDMDEHSIDFYLAKNNKKYRLLADSFNSNDVKSLNEILKYSTVSKIYGSITAEENFDFSSFDSLLIEFDENEYTIPIRYKQNIKGKDYAEKKYSISEKIKYGGNNLFYVNSIEFNASKYSAITNVSLSVSNDIKSYDNHSLTLFIENNDGQQYKLYCDTYFSYSVSDINDLVCSKLRNDGEKCYLTYYTNELDPVALIVNIDGDQTRIELK